MTGLLALLGGREHQPGFEDLDRRLMSHVTGRRPVVTVLPLASSTRKRPLTAGLAVRWWRGLGANVGVAPRDDAAAVAMIRHSDVIVLPGGVPDRLYRRLNGSPVWNAIVTQWRRGASLTGSSSGAIVLGRYRQAMLPPFTLRRGLGLLPNVAAAPHYDEVVPGGLARLRERTDPHMVVIGLDTSTGFVGRNGRFEVVGLGAVHIVHQGWPVRLEPGETFDLGNLISDSAPETATPQLVPAG